MCSDRIGRGNDTTNGDRSLDLFPELLRNQRGSLFVVSIWAITLLVFLVSIIFIHVSQKVSSVKKFRQRMEISHMVVSGVALAKATLARDTNEEEFSEGKVSFDAYSDFWGARPESEFREPIPFSRGTLRVAHLEDPEAETQVWIPGLQDESSKVNLNFASERILRDLFEQGLEVEESQAAELAAAIIDWRDTNEAVHLGGAESEYYEDLEEPYEAKNSLFERKAELLFVRGMDDTLYQRLRPYVTVHTDGRVNLNTAQAVVLKGLGARDSLVRKLIKFREGIDGILGTEDDGVFESASEILSKMTREIALDTEESQSLTQLMATGLIQVKSDIFTAQIHATSDERSQITEVTLDRKGHILAWEES